MFGDRGGCVKDHEAESRADTVVGAERRREPRIPRDMGATWGSAAGRLRDLSIGGACIDTPDSAPAEGESLILEIHGRSPSITVPAVVRWSVAVGTGRRFGVQFRVLTPELAALLATA